MGGVAVLYTAAFALYSLMEVLGVMPQEFRNAGVTLPSLLSAYYGDQVSFFSFLAFLTRNASSGSILELEITRQSNLVRETTVVTRMQVAINFYTFHTPGDTPNIL